MVFSSFLQLAAFFAGQAMAGMTKTGTLCTVTPSGSSDDSGSIMDAFKQCGQNGQVCGDEPDQSLTLTRGQIDRHNRGRLHYCQGDGCS